MSYDVGMAALRLESPERLAHTEYCSNDALVRAVTGHESVTAESWNAFYDAWDYDFLWHIHDGPEPWGRRGRVTDMGHAEFLEGGRDRRETVHCPFTDPEQVLAFDAVEEYGLPDSDELVAFYTDWYRQRRAACPEQVITGGYYKTIVSGAIQSFGWEMLLLAAAEPQRFERVLDSFYRLTRHHVEAWCRTPIDVFIQHDDMVWSLGPFMHPDHYRAVIFPRYRELWGLLHDARKIVLYCSDGDWTMFLDDIAGAGADGFIFEPMVDLDAVVERYGQSHAIVGSKLDCRTLTFGTEAEIRAEIDATLPLAKQCPGFMFAVGNHIPSNVPVSNARFYMDYLRERWRR